MQRFVIHRVGVGSLGRLIGTWFAILALVVGVISAFVSAVAIFDSSSYGLIAKLGLTALATLGWVVLYPIVLFFVGWLNGAVLALIFNLVVAGSGGLSVHAEETSLDGTPKLKVGK